MGIKPLDWLREAIDDDRLTTTERAAVAAITRRAPGQSQRHRFHGQESGWDFYMSRNELAGLMNSSVPTAQRCISRLHELGYLDLVTRGGRRGRGNGARIMATVWTLATPSTARPETFQQITGDLLEEAADDLPTDQKRDENRLPTYQEPPFQQITSDLPREHRYQESAVLQESSAAARRLTPSIAHGEPATSTVANRPTQHHNPSTDRTRQNEGAR